jgi:repressor LexA
MARRREGLSEKHRKILEFLSTFQERHEYPPTIREIGKNIGVNSTSQVDYYLKQLEDRGYIERDSHTSRSIRLLKDETNNIRDSIFSRGIRTVAGAVEAVNELLRIPVVGRIFASQPIPVPQTDVAYFDAESSVDVARSLLQPREKISDLFALEVQGDSMVDAMINEGDIVIMRPAQDALNGELVAVWLNDTNETTLKYFYKEGERVRLQPANPTMGPIYINNPQNLRIMGKVVMVIRQVEGKVS